MNKPDEIANTIGKEAGRLIEVLGLVQTTERWIRRLRISLVTEFDVEAYVTYGTEEKYEYEKLLFSVDDYTEILDALNIKRPVVKIDIVLEPASFITFTTKHEMRNSELEALTEVATKFIRIEDYTNANATANN